MTTSQPQNLSLDVIELLTDWLPSQRWYAGKGRDLHAVTVESVVDLTTAASREARVLDTVLAVDHGSDIIRYQVPLTMRVEPVADLAHALIGETPNGHIYDGLIDPCGSAAWLAHLAAGATVDQLSFHARVEIDASAAGRVVGVEQSNTSVVFGETSILKVFRRLAPGLNPDLEITRALAEAGSPHVAEPYGWVEGTVAGQPTTLAFLQRFLRGSTEGWKLATASVRDLFAEEDLRADEVGGDFAGEAERLGRATAEVHAMLRDTLPSAVVGVEDNAATAKQMRERLASAAAEVEALAPYIDGLNAVYDALAQLPGDVPVQRVHGDYHLGQVLRTDNGWALLDFEGEPARPLSERTVLMSPLRDVAGMLRSFDYAARSLLAERPGETGMAYHAEEWATRNRGAFMDGYAAGGGENPREAVVRLKAFECDKAVYEVVYEARHRPSWLPIPLGTLARLSAR